MRVREVPPKEVVEHRLLFRDPEGADWGLWTYAGWFLPRQQDKLEDLLDSMGVDYTCQRTVF